EGPHAPRGTIDQDLLARLDFASVPEPCKRRHSSTRNRRSRFECEPGWLWREPVLVGERELGERPHADAEDLVANLEAGDVLSDGRDGACQVDADTRALRPAEALRLAEQIRLPPPARAGVRGGGG